MIVRQTFCAVIKTPGVEALTEPVSIPASTANWLRRQNIFPRDSHRFAVLSRSVPALVKNATAIFATAESVRAVVLTICKVQLIDARQTPTA
jgi:hypothetical protein